VSASREQGRPKLEPSSLCHRRLLGNNADVCVAFGRLTKICAGIIASLVALAGCSTSSLFDSDLPVPTSYVIAAALGGGGATPRAPVPVDLSVSRPEMAAGLDTDRIAVLKGRELDYYRRVRWAVRATELVQTVVVDSLANQNWFRSVTPEQARVAGDYVLDLQVRAFQAEYASSVGNPTIRVALLGRVIRIVDRKLIATVQSAAQMQADYNRMHAVVATFEAAAHRAILDLGDQVVAAIRADLTSLQTARERD